MPIIIKCRKEGLYLKIIVKFFDNEIIDAIGGGIYKISVQRKDQEIETLYIGESFSMIIRCATHLYTLNKTPEYFGFSKDTIEDSNTSLIVEILEQETNTITRKQKEKAFIKEYNPIMQSGISDRMNSIEDKISALEEFLNYEKL